MTTSQKPQPVPSAPDFSALWSSARRLHPTYLQLAREFVLDAPAFSALDESVDTPDQETVIQAQQWLKAMDDRIQVHQLRQFLQTNSTVDRDGLVVMLTHFLQQAKHTDATRDKIDFLLVQYFSQGAPTELDDNAADIAYVANGLKPVLGNVELKTPVWLNALDRVLESARRCRSLDEVLHGGILEQGRKAKTQAGDLFYLPVALVAFTRYGYLMRRVFFRLMLGDLNSILDGLNELEEQGIATIDCRRAQFSDKEPVSRLRMICQSWKVMFQAEYSSGQPLRMLVDLRASVDAALGRGAEAEGGEKAAEATAAFKASLQKAAPEKTGAPKKARAAAAGAAAGTASAKKIMEVATETVEDLPSGFSVDAEDAPEFEVSPAAPEWNPDEDLPPRKKK
jgi:hypothetical protein